MSTRAIEKKRLEISCGTIAYVEAGAPDRPVVLLVHGIPTSSYLWRDVIRFLQGSFHCIAPDLIGLGDSAPNARAAFDMDAQAEMLLELMDRLGHRRFSIVAHDQGGAAAQILAARQPGRLDALVLTDSVCFDNWPVPVIRRLQRLAGVPALSELVSRSGLAEWVQRKLPISAFRRGVFDPKRLSEEAIVEYLRPLRDRAGRERFRRFLLAGHARYTETALAGLRRFDKPTLILWAGDDRYLSPSYGQRLCEEIPGARPLRLMPFCGHFWQEERPGEGASWIGKFLEEALAPRAAVTATVAPVAQAAPAPVVEMPAAAAALPPCAPPRRNKLPKVVS